jgi:hypothetical protein
MIFRGRLIHRPDDGGSKDIRNIDLLRDYKALYPGNLSPSVQIKDDHGEF